MAFLTNAIAALAGPPALGAIITATGAYWQGKHKLELVAIARDLEEAYQIGPC